MNYSKLIADLHELADWAECNERETPITLSDTLREAAAVISHRYGAWLTDTVQYYCSECMQVGKKEWRFCAHCGAEMTESETRTNLFDREEIIENCTVQIRTNTVTGERSVGWWRGTKNDMPRLGVHHG